MIGVINEGKLVEEITMEQLHKQNRQYIEFVVSEEGKACLLLKEKFGITDYSIHGNGRIRLYSTFEEPAKINAVFVENGILVSKINIKEEKLEDYFETLIGGGGIA